MSEIAVIDYGMGNLRSVAKALEHVSGPRQTVRVTDNPARIAAAERVVFPGQGAARDCMQALAAHAVIEPLLQAARAKPFLGICMGLQVLLSRSEENDGTDCLGVFPGEVRYFGHGLADTDGRRLKIPHMGWNQVWPRRAHPLWAGIEPGARMYFVHSYYVVPEQASLTAAVTTYGIDFTAALATDNVFALQCHPEKSGAVGLALLANFMHWDGSC